MKTPPGKSCGVFSLYFNPNSLFFERLSNISGAARFLGRHLPWLCNVFDDGRSIATGTDLGIIPREWLLVVSGFSSKSCSVGGLLAARPDSAFVFVSCGCSFALLYRKPHKHAAKHFHDVVPHYTEVTNTDFIGNLPALNAR
jgi:hypothetical protein